MKYSFQLLLVGVLILTLAGNLRSQTANHVVISECYGGGGNSGSLYKNDFVELYNPTASAVTMTNWSIQYASASSIGTFSSRTIFSGTIAPHTFFLIQEAQGSGGTENLPSPDAVGTINFAGSNGKIALVNDTLAITLHTGTNVVDFVGYGTANDFEGSDAIVGPDNTHSAERKAHSGSTSVSMAPAGSDEESGNAFDGNDNSSDFVIQPLPIPQNSSASPETPPTGNLPPVISSVIRQTFIPAVGAADSIIATITDVDGFVTGAKLHVRVNGGAFDSTFTMTHSGSSWRALIPAAKHSANGNLVEYYVSAIDDSFHYASTASALKGYFVGDSPISAIKSRPIASIPGYGVQLIGVINVVTNSFANGQGYVQDATGGLQLFQAGGLPSLAAGRNARMQGPLIDFNGTYEMSPPVFIDTTGSSSLTPVTISLPLSQSPSNIHEGKLVTVQNLTTDSTGNFNSARNYVYKNGLRDTMTVRVESNGSMNSLVGNPIVSSSVNATGILSFSNGYLRLKPRSQTDFGFTFADGSGTASIAPGVRLVHQAAVSETVKVVGDGINTINGVSVQIPPSWSWADTSSKLISGSGFAAASVVVSGDGSVVHPYTIIVSGVSVTGSANGQLVLHSLTTPPVSGTSSFALKTRGTGGILTAIGSSPSVNIVSSGFEAITTGNWNDATTWSGGTIPGPGDDVTMLTLGVVVTINGSAAECRNLTLTGSGSAANSGPLLQFAPTGIPQLTINGNLTIGGGSGSGRGGRAKLTSNGNASSVLIIKHNIVTTSSNSTGNGSAGLNMNEGSVRLFGSSTDTLVNSSGLRLGDLRIGDGISAKSIVWLPTRKSTLAIRSLLVKSDAHFLIGAANDTTANDIGNATSAGVPLLSGGIIIEPGASVSVESFNDNTDAASINLDGGGIRNDGTLILHSGMTAGMGSRYSVNFGGFSTAITARTQIVTGSHPGDFASVTVGAEDTLVVQQKMNIAAGDHVALNGRLIETPGNTIVGAVEATRNVAQHSSESFGGIGAVITAANSAPGTTFIRRVTGAALAGGGHGSILRWFDISPVNNFGLNATLDFFYDDGELSGQSASMLQLWRSPDSGTHWYLQIGTSDSANHRLSASGISTFSRWTAADDAHPLGGRGTAFVYKSGWNLLSIPNSLVDYRKTNLYPSANSNAFGYVGTYIRKDTLENGLGYWIKFASAETVMIEGTPRMADTIDVMAGWNILGSVSFPVPLNSVTTLPADILSTPLFAFNGAYVRTDTISPGSGYWIKTSAAGKILISSRAPSRQALISSQPERGSSFVVSDCLGHQQTLYFGPSETARRNSLSGELPPLPPGGSFDARFDNQTTFASCNGPTVREEPLRISTAAYPLQIRWSNRRDSKMRAVLIVGNKEFDLLHNGSIGIQSPESTITLRLTPQSGIGEPGEFALEQNYPNPFNPRTLISYVLDHESFVTLVIYDLLGRKISTLVDGKRASGRHTIEWDGREEDGKEVAGGVYLVRMVSGTFVQTKRMVLIR